MSHYTPRTQEEEDRALAMALQASLEESPLPPASSQYPRHPAAAPPPQYYPSVPSTRVGQQQHSGPSPAYPARSTAAPHGTSMPSRQPPNGYYPPPSSQQQPAGVRPAAAPAYSMAASSQQGAQRPATQRSGPAALSGPMSSIAAAASNLGAAAAKALSSGSTCDACGRGFGIGPAMSALGKTWHPGCLRCKGCNASLCEGSTASFQVGKDGHPYHAACYTRLFVPVCVICGTHIAAKADGRIEYKESSFWREKYCNHHDLEAGGTRCSSCSRHRPAGEEWVNLGSAAEGHELCLQCVSSIVIDTKDVQPLYGEVLSFYKSLGLPLPSKPSLLLVDGKTLREFAGKEGRDQSGGPIFHVRGLCIATVHRSIPSIMRTVGAGFGVRNVSTPIAGAMETVKCSVSAILVYYGFPRLLTGSIIAHELLHAYLRLRHIAKLDSQVEEGLAQLMAYLWLDQQYSLLEGQPAEQRLASYFTYQIREDRSTVYGDGFRMAYDAYQRAGGGERGLVTVLNTVIRSGKLS